MGKEVDNEYWNLLQDRINEAESLFEQKITYVAAGALVLFIGFVENIIKLEDATCKVLVILSWILVGTSLIINLISQLVSKKHLKDTQQDVVNKVSFKKQVKNSEKRNKIIENWNNWTLVFLILGVLLFILFISLNI